MEPVEQYRQLTAEIERHQRAESDAVQARAEFVRSLLDGRTQKEVAGLLGITQGRVSQLVSRRS